MSHITLCNPTGRNTQAYIVTVGNRTFYFSYRTCIAYDGPDKDGSTYTQARIANHWGPTTGRHFGELGCGSFPIVTDEEFDKITDFGPLTLNGGASLADTVCDLARAAVNSGVGLGRESLAWSDEANAEKCEQLHQTINTVRAMFREKD